MQTNWYIVFLGFKSIKTNLKHAQLWFQTIKFQDSRDSNNSRKVSDSQFNIAQAFLKHFEIEFKSVGYENEVSFDYTAIGAKNWFLSINWMLQQHTDLVFSKGHDLPLSVLHKLIYNDKLELLHKRFNLWKWFFASWKTFT